MYKVLINPTSKEYLNKIYSSQTRKKLKNDINVDYFVTVNTDKHTIIAISKIKKNIENDTKLISDLSISIDDDKTLHYLCGLFVVGKNRLDGFGKGLINLRMMKNTADHYVTHAPKGTYIYNYYIKIGFKDIGECSDDINNRILFK